MRPESIECYAELDSSDYRGHVSVTRNGNICQPWNVQVPHVHYLYGRDPDNGIGNHNYCRNPDGEPSAWCYTMDPNIRFELCDVGQPRVGCLSKVEPSARECFTSANGDDYRGTVSTTESGYICQPWTSQLPYSHRYTPEIYPNAGLGDHNYCRNPDGWSATWCYTLDPLVRWESCDVGSPQTTCQNTGGKFKLLTDTCYFEWETFKF
ncbi:plasminogen-like [Ptychodera flava]|uniref:plasminogen-like n=1 Tax=Ptychodera flava TaxID=63121 RepID=UPI00396A5A99